MALRDSEESPSLEIMFLSMRALLHPARGGAAIVLAARLRARIGGRVHDRPGVARSHRGRQHAAAGRCGSRASGQRASVAGSPASSGAGACGSSTATPSTRGSMSGRASTSPRGSGCAASTRPRCRRAARTSRRRPRRHAMRSRAILAEGAVGIFARHARQVRRPRARRGFDAPTPDVSAALLQAGLVRRYAGGRREHWC